MEITHNLSGNLAKARPYLSKEELAATREIYYKGSDMIVNALRDAHYIGDMERANKELESNFPPE